MDYEKKKEEYIKKIHELCTLKGYSKKTAEAYSHVTKKYMKFLSKTSLNMNIESVKYYLLSLDLSTNSSRLHYAALRFLFKDILKRPFSIEEVPNKKKEKRLPKVLSKEDIKKMIENTTNIKHRIIIKLLYSSGMRLEELINLRRDDIDFDKNIIYVRQGKGKKDRNTIIAESLKLDLLKYYSQDTFNTKFLLEGREGRYSKKSVQLVLSKAGKKNQQKSYTAHVETFICHSSVG